MRIGALKAALTAVVCVAVVGALVGASYAFWAQKAEAEMVTQVDVGPFNPSEKYIVFKGIDDDFRFAPLVPATEFVAGADAYRAKEYAKAPGPELPGFPEGYFVFSEAEPGEDFPAGLYVRKKSGKYAPVPETQTTPDSGAKYYAREPASGSAPEAGTKYCSAVCEYLGRPDERPGDWGAGAYFVDGSPGITAYAAVGYVGLVSELIVPDSHERKPVSMIASYAPVAAANKGIADHPLIAEITVSPNVRLIKRGALRGLAQLRKVVFEKYMEIGILPAGKILGDEGEAPRYWTDANGMNPARGAPDGNTEYFIRNYECVGKLDAAPPDFPTGYFYQRGENGLYYPIELYEKRGESFAPIAPDADLSEFPAGHYARVGGTLDAPRCVPAAEIDYFKPMGYASAGKLPAAWPEGYFAYGYKRIPDSAEAPPNFPNGYYAYDPDTTAYEAAVLPFDETRSYYVVAYVSPSDGAPGPDGKTVYHIERQLPIRVEEMAFADCGSFGASVYMENYRTEHEFGFAGEIAYWNRAFKNTNMLDVTESR